jgi:SAM-dependent methyltransferase
MRVIRTVLEADLARLSEERREADRRYNEALTALDAAVAALPPAPDAPPAAADGLAPTPATTNSVKAALPAPGSGWRGWLTRFVVAVVAPAFERQQAINDAAAALAASDQALERALSAAISQLSVQTAQLARIETQLILFLQQITPYVDTKDYEVRGLATRITEDVADGHARLAAAVDALTTRVEAALVRIERSEGVRDSLSALQLAVHALRREVASRATAPPPVDALPTSPVAAAPFAASPVTTALSTDRLSSHKYVAFEDLFRGDRAAVRDRQRSYLPLFDGRSDVLDIGCGRGEFLHLLAERGVRTRGLDLNHEMAAACRADGLDVQETDALGYLRSLDDDALGGLVALQVVEHLAPDYLIALIDEAFRVLRPGSPIVLETINVASWYAFFNSYVRDITHVRPLHSDTLKFLVVAAGFLDASVELRVPLPPSEQLTPAPADVHALERDAAGATVIGLLALADAFDRNVARLNAHLFAPLDYAVVARKPGP